MTNNNRYKIEKQGNKAWEKAMQIFEKHLKDLTLEEQKELIELIDWDFPTAAKEKKDTRERIEKAEKNAETSRLLVEYYKGKVNAS
ncbi:MAG: hypothetical protein ACOZCL_08550 [Bacillota bacterium]